MLVKILKDCVHTGIKAGEVYKAKSYHLDPAYKLELLERVSDGHDPCCTEYRINVEVIEV